jgi:hypothetical protein
MQLKPTAECQISILIFENKLWRGGLYKYPMKNISRTAKFLPTFGQVKGIAWIIFIETPSTIFFQISELIFDTLLWA